MTVITKTYVPFVRINKPFVGRETALVIPFIGHKYPFICFSGKSWGFTVIELVVTLSVAAILVTLAIPAMTRLIESNRFTTLTNEFIHSLQLARSAAIKHSSQTMVCKSNTGAGCTGGGTTWNSGWIVFVDSDNSGGFSAGDTLLKVHEAVTGKSAFSALAAPVSAPAADSIVYNRLGGVASGNGNYWITNTELGETREICIWITGSYGDPPMADKSCP